MDLKKNIVASVIEKRNGCAAGDGVEFSKPEDDKYTFYHLWDLPRKDWEKFLSEIDVVMFDCDGVIWLGNTPLENAQDLVKLLRSLGKRIFFITNNSTKTRQEFLTKLNTLGFEAELEEIVSTSYLAALYLKEQNFAKKVYVIGTTGVVGELNELGIDSLPIGEDLSLNNIENWAQVDLAKIELDNDVGAVIVGFDFHVNYVKIFKAATYLHRPGTIFIATNTDESFPALEGFIVPGTGSIVKAVETAAGRPPIIMGKPGTMPFDFISRFYKLDAKKTLMIGDRGNTDIMFGRNCGMWTLLVLTGVTTMEEVATWHKSGSEEDRKCIPNFFLNNVSELFNFMKLE